MDGHEATELNENVFTLLKNSVSIFENLEHLFLQLRTRENNIIISFVNSHAVNMMHSNLEFKECIFTSDLILRDGAGVELFYRSISVSPGLNLNGTDFIPILLKEYKGLKVALWGTTSHSVNKAKFNLQKNGYNIISTLDGFKNENEYLIEYNRIKPDIVILGMGMPKQERIAHILRNNATNNASLIINGGAVIDFIAGRFIRAPKIIQKFKLEWSYRLFLEPKRLFNRYVIGNFVFIYRLIAYFFIKAD